MKNINALKTQLHSLFTVGYASTLPHILLNFRVTDIGMIVPCRSQVHPFFSTETAFLMFFLGILFFRIGNFLKHSLSLIPTTLYRHQACDMHLATAPFSL